MDKPTTWNMKYWDMAEQFYWAPQYTGLKSIPRRLWAMDGDRISVPANLVNKTGPLYTRLRNQADQRTWMVAQEEVLNHVFDITFAIAPDQLISNCFCAPLSVTDQGPFTSVGREIAMRFGWKWSENVTQHDGFFVSPRSALAVELKLRARSSANQIIKYAALLAWEEMHSGPRKNLGLLYILQDKADEKHWEHCGLADTAIDRSFLEKVDFGALPARVRALLSENSDAVGSVLDRLKLAAITWADLKLSCSSFCEELDAKRPGDQSLIKLVQGFLSQIDLQVPTSD